MLSRTFVATVLACFQQVYASCRPYRSRPSEPRGHVPSVLLGGADVCSESASVESERWADSPSRQGQSESNVLIRVASRTSLDAAERFLILRVVDLQKKVQMMAVAGSFPIFTARSNPSDLSKLSSWR